MVKYVSSHSTLSSIPGALGPFRDTSSGLDRLVHPTGCSHTHMESLHPTPKALLPWRHPAGSQWMCCLSQSACSSSFTCTPQRQAGNTWAQMTVPHVASFLCAWASSKFRFDTHFSLLHLLPILFLNKPLLFSHFPYQNTSILLPCFILFHLLLELPPLPFLSSPPFPISLIIFTVLL